MKQETIDINQIIPNQASEGTWIGRCMVPAALAYNGIAGPHVVKVANGKVYDLSAHFNSTSELINTDNVAEMMIQLDALPVIGELKDILKNSLFSNRDNSLPCFIAPNDLQSVKACGVTFVKSLLERVIEEKARGNAKKADQVRQTIYETLGNDLSKTVPGSPETEILKKRFQEEGIWSQYLEVGIGKDAEVFTKSQPMSAVGFGAQVGVLKDSVWNNPEPEIVLAISSKGKIVGATLGNDVNLRDYEGRSALLLGEAKDQNGSCSIGPLFRLFDKTFSIDDVKNCEVELTITGEDGFSSSGANKMNEISRSPENLTAQVIGKNHQYPDGLVLFLGTMFAPTENRDADGKGFTHKIGDQVIIASEKLGQLINWVNTCDQIPRWEFGIHSFIDFLIKRNKL
ncbi:fumarylacetoacetate hydrolase family protein [Chitinophagaceae bacterium LB-8]|uniref:Fumarylacetoacetate hydrolase family protein n=1 Tax=Paraflavisolibacter caeni TaxID=2982496 RepID=A0A9X3BK53_9BACT|nr:fumarylacetoacetate hydrolase family protein [Paraflavisolibacter caeni]MCU7552218.1 fumarylacetoacetate hydrolase family protein [Paraflavisolibacter caeni]